jgi:hypothetical protein
MFRSLQTRLPVSFAYLIANGRLALLRSLTKAGIDVDSNQWQRGFVNNPLTASRAGWPVI